MAAFDMASGSAPPPPPLEPEEDKLPVGFKGERLVGDDLLLLLLRKVGARVRGKTKTDGRAVGLDTDMNGGLEGTGVGTRCCDVGFNVGAPVAWAAVGRSDGAETMTEDGTLPPAVGVGVGGISTGARVGTAEP